VNSLVVDFLEDVLESAVVFLHDRVLGGHELFTIGRISTLKKIWPSKPTSGKFLSKAILNAEWAKPEIDYRTISIRVL
jgi:hypothetical protein